MPIIYFLFIIDIAVVQHRVSNVSTRTSAEVACSTMQYCKDDDEVRVGLVHACVSSRSLFSYADVVVAIHILVAL